MDSDYDRKFEEMKKYIPFLENMIKRLESTSAASANPRQAQLDKIKSLRDLLLDKKKRMKMENLLKCEQVLVNLYAKVEQRDTQPNPNFETTAQNSKSKDSTDLEAVRNKLKSVVRSSTVEGQETLPEIARASVIEETCTPGSKEPALFQRRPNRASKSPVRNSQKSPNKAAASSASTKRNYTRVLLSPEPSSRRWDSDNKISEKPLFSRRSPRRSPKRYSPTYNKKERKKLSKQSQSKKSKDLNITLNVPEESLESLNSKDILSRIMNCNDNDVDIETLREAKRQILSELKHTGAKCDDISDLLLKSYNKTSSSLKMKDEVEEGELSDSESETIQSIYGNFILDESDTICSDDKTSKTREKPRKIQICLVINSDKGEASTEVKNDGSQDTDLNDFEMYNLKSSSNIKQNFQVSTKDSESKSNPEGNSDEGAVEINEEDSKVLNVSAGQVIAKNKDNLEAKSKENAIENSNNDNVSSVETTQSANFYKPLKEDKLVSNKSISEQSLAIKDTKENPITSLHTDNVSEKATHLNNLESDETEIEIPLLHDQSIATQKPKEDVVSEIDILQALKKEILSESLSIPGSETTPLMHQPKLTKVASVQEIVPKKRISIEKYKKKSIPSTTTVNSLFVSDPSSSLTDDSMSSKEDNLKKQSLKLTEKECERFNFPAKLALDDDDAVDGIVSSDEDHGKELSLNDIYENLAPKSPDFNDSSSIKNIPPVIIPVDPVKTVLAPSKSDIDMRAISTNVKTIEVVEHTHINQELAKNNIDKTKTLVDPRVRRDARLSVDKAPSPVPNYTNTPNSVTNINPSMTQKIPLLMTPSLPSTMTPNRTPNMTPNRVPNMTPNMTPSRNPNMTPNARSYEIGGRHQFEAEEMCTNKHVYAPMFPLYDPRDSREQSVAKELERRPQWEQLERESKTKTRESRWGDSSENRGRYSKNESRTVDYSKTSYSESHNKYDNFNLRLNDRRDYSRSDCPRTPLPAFGRSEAPSTPSHPFGRLDSPMTPVHPFGRSDCPQTPSHPFGRSDCPPTPNHPFGRSDYTWNECPTTPSHSFGRGDMPSTPSHPFGRPEPQSRDPRLNRMSDYDTYQKDDSDRNYQRDRIRPHFNNSYRPESKKPDSYRSYREHSVGGSERNNYPESDSRNFKRDQSFRRDASIGRGMPRDDRFFSRDRNHEFPRNEYRRNTDRDILKKEFHREHSIGRSMPTDDRMHHMTPRAPSVGQTDNRMSVQRDTGTSFTINTSVRSTFQDFLREDKIRVFDNSFDRRQKRASSVGRTLCRDSSVGRSLPNKEFSKCSNTIPDRNNFRRARSVGRDILTAEKDRTFKDIKADFEKFYKEHNNSESHKTLDAKDPRKHDKYSDTKNQNNLFIKKDRSENVGVESGNKKPYSPRKNSRDPRLRHNSQSTKNKIRDYYNEERERKNIGIVYSNDNITKGTILGSGYGVKNYKIPKIKRSVEEKQEDTLEEEVKKEQEIKKDNKMEVKESNRKDDKITEKLESKIVKNKTQKVSKLESKSELNKALLNSPKKNVNNEDKPEKRITRLSKKSENSVVSSEDETGTKTKKSKRSVIIDSDSDEVETIKKGSPKKSLKTPSPKTNQQKDVPKVSIVFNENLSKSKENKTNEITSDISNMEILNKTSNDDTLSKINNENFEQSFAMDDLELFSDNLASDPVIDNINALIADLDNDLEPSKMTATEFGDSINIENMLDSIAEGDDENSKILTEDLNDISEVIKNDMNESVESPKLNSLKNASDKNKDNLEDNDYSSNQLKANLLVASKSVETSMKNSVSCEHTTNDNIDSTTEINKESFPSNQIYTDKPVLEASSVPDSTNDVNAKKNDLEDSLPDSTNETQTDVNALVTSSHDSLDAINKDGTDLSSCSKETPSINSIGNILSILQDRTKLKEILSLLGDQSVENEKIKKKLEKLSEIVSDEDDELENNQYEKSKLDVNVESTQLNDKDSATNELLKDSNASTADVSSETPKDTVLTQRDKEKEDPEVTSETTCLRTETDELNTDNKTVIKEPKKSTIRKAKVTKRGKRKMVKTAISKGVKRVTRSANVKVKKTSRELLQLQEDLKEMFISDDVLNATGIRMCRLAKLVNDDIPKLKDDINTNDPGPVVVLEKFKDLETTDETKLPVTKVRKKPGPKTKLRVEGTDETDNKFGKFKSLTYKPGPKSKTKNVHKSDDEDPYAFETDSVSETNDSIRSLDDKCHHSSDTESESICSSQSFGSTELLVELKKKTKRKRSAWQSGVIKPKNRKKKLEVKHAESFLSELPVPQKPLNQLDINCFTDKTYCFRKNIFNYSCRLCSYNGENIVNHYKQEHPHSEIPLSRLSPEMAKEAIVQCGELNFQAVSKVSSEKYICRFCFREFGKKKAALEAFFWHIVSMHTGEYKHSCSLCVNEAKCPFKLDIPPPPKDVKGQLIGYICEKCNFTQISLENLKTHVIVRHNDEQTEVYTINLAVMSRKAISQLLKRNRAQPKKLRVLRSGTSNQSMTETSDDHSDVTDSDHSSDPLSTSFKDISILSISTTAKEPTSPTLTKDKPVKLKMQSKITFENDDNLMELSTPNETVETIVKKETIEEEIRNNKEIEVLKNNLISEICGIENVSEAIGKSIPVDIQDCAHFKISYTESGSKEYVCCVNGIDNHYKTALLISLKKHVQFKHSEVWDGYCFLCKVIVTPQGKHNFKDCLEHYLDKHMDNFPVLEKIPVQIEEKQDTGTPVEVQSSANKSYINVRPMSELMSKEVLPKVSSNTELQPLPKIENVMSLGHQSTEPPLPQASPSYPTVITEPPKDDKEYRFEEVQAEVMSKKHRVVLDTMMSMPKLVDVFKCAGSYCSFTSDSPEQALLHASTHQRVGGENSLICSYCDFDCSGNGIDLVMHVFKAHGACPYVCGYCFYRAAASQLVTAHISRIHRDAPAKVLSVPNAAPPQNKDGAMLKREAVVRYYICSHACNFRTYTAGRFCEHLVHQHSSEQFHLCSICQLPLETPQRLIQHMKTHELNVYQCTWCVHGADSESSLLFHASQKHPDKQPMAYLRVITNKDGSSSTAQQQQQQLRVLPLVSFNKSKVAVTEVSKIPNNNNPVREAERSIELEKLIGHTKTMIESMASDPIETVVEPPSETETAVTSIIEENNVTEDIQEPTVAAVIAPVPAVVPQPPVTPPPAADLSEQVTPKIKTEPEDKTPTKALPTEIVCLDSDDENSRDTRAVSSIIALSDDESSTLEHTANVEDRKYKLIPPALLLKCPNCWLTYKNAGGFRRHTNICTPVEKPWTCAHCSMVVENRDALIKHYLEDHNESKSLYICDACKSRFATLFVVKSHMKNTHGIAKITVLKKNNKDYMCVADDTVSKPTSAPKRKNSGGASEPPKKQKRFGPQDMDLLPINPILDESVSCSLCEFNTKVRINMVRHLQFHADQQPVPQTAPINPVPHLETNEKHFDKMVNLASSSIVTRAPEKPRPEGNTTVSVLIPPEAASRYPKYVPDRQRHTCGAKGCSYISLDEAMLRCHWETLHSGSNDFHCVHCPPYQHLDTSKPLTSARIIAHLKMHDATLYACSACAYYHYKKQVLEKHLSEVHKGSGRLMVVREEVISPPNPVQAAPTMDLKPWQCGVCSFKSMLRPEVVEHCAKVHQSKMQFKCSYCPFRTSALENVTKHQTNAHPKKEPEVFYYYYREGSIPDEADGTPKWLKQRQKMSITDPEVKSEVIELNQMTLSQLIAAPMRPPTLGLDLNIVKKEVDDPVAEMSLEQLLEKYGQPCEPNGLRYKCPLCKIVIEDTKEAMQSHLYEELKYRKWSCAMCPYKAYHKTGLNEHIVQEHRGRTQEPRELPSDGNIEKWVGHILRYQTNSIEKNKENLTKQKMVTERPSPSTSTKPTSTITEKLSEKYAMKDLEIAFGKLGVPNNMFFSCPKCDFKVKDEAAMRDHLESELSRIRWCCSNCDSHFQTYHEAQFHCKSIHVGGVARPLEAIRDPALRAAWVQAALQVQRLSMNCLPLADSPPPPPPSQSPPSSEDSLLVIRYEESVTTNEPQPRKRDTHTKGKQSKCPHCPFKIRNVGVMRDHMLKHFNLKPCNCNLCDFSGSRVAIACHLKKCHGCEYKPEYVKMTEMPSGPIVNPNVPYNAAQQRNKKSFEEDATKILCLICEKSFTEPESATHMHDKTKPEFGKKGDVVVKCCICLALRLDQASLYEHHNASHPDVPINYAFFKLFHDTREILSCDHCAKRFKFIKDLKSHHNATHNLLPLKYSTVPYLNTTMVLDSDEEDELTIADETPKRVARKSTTKLPAQAVAKKSTTKLPYDVSDEEDMAEYSYYGTKPPSADEYANVTTLMSFYNTMVPFTTKKLSEVLNINPTVIVKDIGSKHLPRY